MTGAAPKSRLWLVVAFALAFFAIGSVLWTTPYSEISLPNTLLTGVLVAVVVAAVVARVFGRAGFLVATLVVGAAVPAANAVRVFVDTVNDPTSHNLWPIELFMSGMVGCACAATGAIAVTLWNRTVGKRG